MTAVSDERFENSGVFSLEFDGASKGNPGKAGAGAILKGPDGSVVCELRKGVGIATNNFAEYRALIIGLQAALDLGVQHIRAQGDSKLVCSQVMGEWKLRSENLATSFEEAMELKGRFKSFSIQHVMRELNSAADKLANVAVDLPEDKSLNNCISSSDPGECSVKAQKRTSCPKHGVGKETKKVGSTRRAHKRQLEGMRRTMLNVTSHCTDSKSFGAFQIFYRMEFHGAYSDKHGKAGAGALLYSPDGLLQVEIRQGVEAATLYAAHYHALIMGLRAALDGNVSHLRIQGDALLVFKQMTGKTKVKDANLLVLWQEANTLLCKFTGFSINHVDKTENSLARALAVAAVQSPDDCSSSQDGFNASSCDMGSSVASQGQNVGIRKVDVNCPNPSMKASITVRNDLLTMGHHGPPACMSSQGWLRPSYGGQASGVLRMKTPCALSPPFSGILSKYLSLPPRNASICRALRLLSLTRMKFLPHFFQSSLMPTELPFPFR